MRSRKIKTKASSLPTAVSSRFLPETQFMPLRIEDMLLLSQENELLDKTASEIEKLYGIPSTSDTDEWIYELACRWIFSKKLHVYFSEGKVIDYYVHRYILDLRII
jgi:hypothetical protein